MANIREYKIQRGPRRGVVLYEVDGKNFDSRAAAEQWAKSPWPRVEPVTGRLVTSDNYAYPPTAKGRRLAAERQKNLKGK